MPKYKIAFFATVIAAFLALLSISVVMTWPRFQKTTEILPDLISELNGNEALLQIRAELDAAAEQLEISGSGGDSESAMWTGSVGGAKYRTLSGRESVYYICPYIIAEKHLSETDSVIWTLSLHFAVSGLEDGKLVSAGNRFRADQINFAFRVSDDRLISRVGYGDGEMSEARDLAVSYQFRDREKITSETRAVAKLEVIKAADGNEGGDAEENFENNAVLSELPLEADELLELLEEFAAQEEPDVPGPETETADRAAVLNWSFVIHEKTHLIRNFDDVQMDFSDSSADGGLKE